MTRGVFVTGTDTGIGKTVFAAALTGALEGTYWKPVQAGLDGETDSETVSRLSGRPVLLAPRPPPKNGGLFLARHRVTVRMIKFALWQFTVLVTSCA